MALTASRVSSGPVVTRKASLSTSRVVLHSFPKLLRCRAISFCSRVNLRDLRDDGQFFKSDSSFCNDNFGQICKNHVCLIRCHRSSVSCQSTRIHGSETKECIKDRSDCSFKESEKAGKLEGKDSVMPLGNIDSNQGLAQACKFVHNDAKFVNERARNDFILLLRGIMRLDARARQDVAILGSEFLKLDARAREDTQKIDYNVKRKAERLHHIATYLKDRAQSRLRNAANKHWSDGALEADLRRADFHAKQRAMEDTLMALEFVKKILDMMVSRMSNCPLRQEKGSLQENDMMGHITIEKNGRMLDLFSREVSSNRINAIQEAYWSMATALSEADGIDYTDPDELELLIATLIDLDAMDGKSSVSLLAECSSSPNVDTRQALANALAAAPSMWTLGNAGMGALQRLAEDSDPAVAAAASNAIYELKKQWNIEEGDCWGFMMDQKPTKPADIEAADDDPDGN